MKNDEKRRDSAASGAVPDAGGAVLVAVSTLMDERRRFESWISALEARRAATPEHVFSRVHADYASRLHTVISQLTTHADGLRRELESMTKRLDVLRDERQRAEDARAEAELRAHVGELSVEDWATTSAASSASLADIGQRHQTVEHELVRTRELLEAAERPVAQEAVVQTQPAVVPVVAAVPAAVAASAPPEPSPSAGTVSDVAEAALHVPVAQTSVPVAPPGEPAGAPPAASSQSSSSAGVAEKSEPAPPAPDAAQQSLGIVEHVMPRASKATPHPSSSAIPSRASSFDELAFLSSVVDSPSGPPEPPAPADMADEKSRTDSFARRSREDAIVNLSESGNVPTVPREMDYQREADSVLSRSTGSAGVDGAKTLKCGECGAMNYPTEWYCERCGAELASL